jgi:hypothetical protein
MCVCVCVCVRVFCPCPSGPFEVIDMCAALDIEPIITLAYDLNDPLDWADLVECEFNTNKASFCSVNN